MPPKSAIATPSAVTSAPADVNDEFQQLRHLVNAAGLQPRLQGKLAYALPQLNQTLTTLVPQQQIAQLQAAASSHHRPSSSRS